MKKIVTLILLLFITTTALSQIQRQRRTGDPLRDRIPAQPPTEIQKEKMEREMEERKQQFILDFVNKLEGDEFQKEITKQTINDYFDKKIEFLKFPFESIAERKDAIKAFDTNHFSELKTLISESDMKKITDLIEGNKTEDEDDKKKKKRRRKKDKG